MSAELSEPRLSAEATPPWVVGQVVAGRYRVARLLGLGGMGAVYAAEQIDLGREVALKALLSAQGQSERGTTRLMREARTVARLQHPNIVDVFDVGVDEGVPFLVMELLRGEPLSAIVARGALDPKEACRLLVPALRGVAAAHAAGVVHRDLKPENIFLCRSETGAPGRVLVLDFGVAVDEDRAQIDTKLTRSGTIVGTPHYMAPEQLAGEPVDARTDVYALASILYELITGFPPFVGPTFALLATAKLTGRVEPMRAHRPEVDARLEAVVQRALEREPAERTQTVGAFARELAQVVGDVDPGELPEPAGGARPTITETSRQRGAQLGRSPSRAVWLAIAALAIVALLLGTAALAARWGASRAAAPPVAAPDELGLPSEPDALAPTPAAEPDPPSPAEPAPPSPAEPTEAVLEAETSPELAAEPPATDETEPSTMGRRSGPRTRGRTGRLTWDDF